jgi:excinuclease ABC subunit B
MPPFFLKALFPPAGDQPQAIAQLVAGLREGQPHQTLLGVTGSGKTFTMAHVIAQMDRPALVLAPNKTLAAQLFAEFKDLFPDNAVEYFVSYYDYYQPEAYLPASDTYIAKDSAINDSIDMLRHSATRSLLTRRDVLIVASVSCIYGLGSPEEYRTMHLLLRRGEQVAMIEVQRRLAQMLYQRNAHSFHRGVFRVRGDVLDIFPVYEEKRALRLEFFGEEIEAISLIDPLRGTVLESVEELHLFPSSHYVTGKENLERALGSIEAELAQCVEDLQAQHRLVEAQRLDQRTRFDLEMIQELGYCNGIENYSRHLTGKPPGEPPPTLLDYFPEDFLLFVDESHIALPQIAGMYKGDRARKTTLVDFGFRLPSALDNRPLRFDEFTQRVHQAIYVSATPGPYELEQAQGRIVQQLIRPTGLLDPYIEVRPASNQVDDLLEEIRRCTAQGQAVLVTTLTKRMAEELTDYYARVGVQIRYLHSDIKTLDRVDLIRSLRQGDFNVLVGINLLREGLDIPEVALVAVLDADKEGFLRSERSLVQTCGRAARNVQGRVLLYADKLTQAIRSSLKETQRRRKIQEAFNQKYGIVPKTVVSEIKDAVGQHLKGLGRANASPMTAEPEPTYQSSGDMQQQIKVLEEQMQKAARNLAFEEAAALRDQLIKLKGLKNLV